MIYKMILFFCFSNQTILQAMNAQLPALYSYLDLLFDSYFEVMSRDTTTSCPADAGSEATDDDEAVPL
jgi:hypothetical protein